MNDSLKDLMERVQRVLDEEIRGRLRSHLGDAHILSISQEGDVVLRMEGFCSACPNRPLTYGGLIIPKIEAIPGVRSVAIDGLHLSEASLDRVRRLGAGEVGAADAFTPGQGMPFTLL